MCNPQGRRCVFSLAQTTKGNLRPSSGFRERVGTHIYARTRCFGSRKRNLRICVTLHVVLCQNVYTPQELSTISNSPPQHTYILCICTSTSYMNSHTEEAPSYIFECCAKPCDCRCEWHGGHTQGCSHNIQAYHPQNIIPTYPATRLHSCFLVQYSCRANCTAQVSAPSPSANNAIHDHTAKYASIQQCSA